MIEKFSTAEPARRSPTPRFFRPQRNMVHTCFHRNGPCCVFAVALVASAVVWAATVIGAPPVDSLHQARDLWAQIQNAAPKDPDGWRKGLEAEQDYWGGIMRRCQAAMKEVEVGDDRKVKLKYFVDQFGQHGPQADIRWLMAEPVAALPDTVAPKISPNYHGPATEICELETRHFIAEPKILDRYYRALVWLGIPWQHGDKQVQLFGIMWQSTEKAFAKKDAFHYWWAGRNFLLLAHSTGRDDLLKNADPEKLSAVFEKWSPWMKQHMTLLRPNSRTFRYVIDKAPEPGGYNADIPFPPLPTPELPFDDWRQPPRVPRDGLIQDMLNYPRSW